MNRKDLDPAEVPRLIFQLANALFQPKQLLLYGVRNTRGPKDMAKSKRSGSSTTSAATR